MPGVGSSTPRLFLASRLTPRVSRLAARVSCPPPQAELLAEAAARGPASWQGKAPTLEALLLALTRLGLLRAYTKAYAAADTLHVSLHAGGAAHCDFDSAQWLKGRPCRTARPSLAMKSQRGPAADGAKDAKAAKASAGSAAGAEASVSRRRPAKKAAMAGGLGGKGARRSAPAAAPGSVLGFKITDAGSLSGTVVFW